MPVVEHITIQQGQVSKYYFSLITLTSDYSGGSLNTLSLKLHWWFSKNLSRHYK